MGRSGLSLAHPHANQGKTLPGHTVLPGHSAACEERIACDERVACEERIACEERTACKERTACFTAWHRLMGVHMAAAAEVSVIVLLPSWLTATYKGSALILSLSASGLVTWASSSHHGLSASRPCSPISVHFSSQQWYSFSAALSAM